MSSNQLVHIIIVTYNGMPWIDRCLKSAGDYPVIVVDNNSTDQTVAFIAQNFPDVTIREQSKNLGFGKANNIGIKHAMDQDCKAVFLLNQDAYLQPQTLQKLQHAYTLDTSYGILCPVHVNGKGDNLDVGFAGYMARVQNSQFYSDCFFQRLDGVYDVPFVNAAGWFLPRHTLDTIGGFDPIFFHYGEDDNYCQRVRYHNLKIGLVSDSLMHHDRENRGRQPIVEYSENYWRKQNTAFITCYADVNRSFNYKRVLLNQGLAILKHMTRLEWTHFKNKIKLFLLKKKWIEQSRSSRSTNRSTGSHYL